MTVKDIGIPLGIKLGAQFGMELVSQWNGMGSVPVGWNCTNSMSWLASPARETIAVPSPVHVWAEVQEK